MTQGWIGVIECESDSLIDSLHYPGIENPIMVTTSTDGRYVAGIPLGGYHTRIWDAVSRTMIVDLQSLGERPVFLQAIDEMMTWTTQYLRFYSLPEFLLDTTLEIDLYLPKHIPGQDLLMAVDQRGPSTTTKDNSLIVVFDASNREIIDSFVIEPDDEGVGFQVFQYDLSPDGTRLYALGSHIGAIPEFLCISIITRQVLFRKQVFIPNGYCRVTPDGQEVWYTDPGTALAQYDSWPGVIVIVDANTGATLDTIGTTGYFADSTKPLYPQDIRFLPDESKTYINCGSGSRGRQPVLIIDRESREIVDTIFPEFTDLAEWIDMAPAP